MKILKSILTLFVIACVNSAFCQDPEFTQFYANPIYLNPAMAGTHGCPRVNINHRNQWPNISGAFITNTISYDQYVAGINGGIAISMMNDMAGKNTLNWNSLNFAYSYHLPVTKKFSFLFGAQAGWNQKFLDWNKLSFGDQIDPHSGFVYQTGDFPRSHKMLDNGWGTRGFFDASAGIVGFSDVFYFGFAAKHLNTPDQTLILSDAGSELPMRFTGHMGANIPLGGKSKYTTPTSLSPNVVYTYQDEFMQLNLGMLVKYGSFTAGAWWREGDAFILLVGIDSGTFKFGYSYDITTSKLTNASGGSHELSLGLNFNCKKPIPKFRTISCPSF